MGKVHSIQNRFVQFCISSVANLWWRKHTKFQWNRDASRWRLMTKYAKMLEERIPTSSLVCCLRYSKFCVCVYVGAKRYFKKRNYTISHSGLCHTILIELLLLLLYFSGFEWYKIIQKKKLMNLLKEMNKIKINSNYDIWQP